MGPIPKFISLPWIEGLRNQESLEIVFLVEQRYFHT